MKNDTQIFTQGFVALFVIVIVSSVALTMALTSSFIGFGELDSGYTSEKSNEALALADGCMEEALTRVRTESGYAGELLVLSNGDCTISVSTLGAINTITVLAQTSASYFKTLESVVSKTNRTLTIMSWEEKS
jgi:uncharacterized protein YdiU (UPF0061 family)